MHIDIPLFWAIFFAEGIIFFFCGLIYNKKVCGKQEKEHTMVLEYGIIDRDKKIKELS